MTVQPSGDSRGHIADVTLSLSRLGSQLPEARNLTAAGDLRRALEAQAQGIVNFAGAIAAKTAGENQQRLNEDSRSWFQRNFFVGAKRRAEEERAVTQKAESAGVLASAAAGMAVTGVDRYLQSRDKRGSLRIVRDLIGYAAQSPDGTMTEASEVIFYGVMDGFGLSDAHRRRLEKQPLPRDWSELRGCTLQEPLLSAATAISFSAMAAASNVDDALRTMPRLLLRLGLPQPTAEARTQWALEEYQGARLVLTDHYQVIQSAVAGTALRLGLQIAQIQSVAERINACNPYEQARQANLRTLAMFVGTGCRLALHGSTPVGPGMSVAVSLVNRFFGQQPGVSRPQIVNAFQSHANANGFPRDEVLPWALGNPS
jgi:hypothetical protein